MIRSITRKKTEEELKRLLGKSKRIFIAGCGTCTTLTHTGGQKEVDQMKSELTASGKVVTGTTVIPVACDNLSAEILATARENIGIADTILVMSCAYGVQTLALQLRKMVVPALDTLFIGKETAHREFNEVCQQCGTCIIGETGGICPVTTCHKGLVNGPCGGTDNGKCEIDKNIPCAWTQIYRRLKELDRLYLMRTLQKPRNFLGEPSPGRFTAGGE